VLNRAAEVSRQAPEKFDKLTSLLASFVDHPEWLILVNNAESDSGDDSKLILDCVRKLKEQNLIAKRKQLTLELKSSSGSDRHEELMKALMELKKEELQLKAQNLTTT
jgi:DNA primase